MEYRGQRQPLPAAGGGGPLLQLQRPPRRQPAPRPGLRLPVPHLPPPAARGFEGSVLGPKYVDGPGEQPGPLLRRLTPAVDCRPVFCGSSRPSSASPGKEGGALRAGGPPGPAGNLGQLYQGFGEAARQDTGEGPGKAPPPPGDPHLPPPALPGEGHFRGGGPPEWGPVQKRVLPVLQAADGRAPVRLPAGLPEWAKRPGAAPVRLHRGRKRRPVGIFHPPAYFSKVFRARTGRSPSEYRRENRGED